MCERSWSITRRLCEQNPRRCDNQGLPIGFILTGGEASDYTAAEPLMEITVAAPKALLADKGYDGERFRESLLILCILPIIPPRSNRKVPEHPDHRRYWDRNRVEYMLGKLKQQRRIAARRRCANQASHVCSSRYRLAFGQLRFRCLSAMSAYRASAWPFRSDASWKPCPRSATNGLMAEAAARLILAHREKECE